MTFKSLNLLFILTFISLNGTAQEFVGQGENDPSFEDFSITQDKISCQKKQLSDVCKSVKNKANLIDCNNLPESRNLNPVAFLAGCSTGLFDSVWEMIKFVWDVLKWGWSTSTQYDKAHQSYQASSEYIASVKLYLVNEYDKAYEKASTGAKAIKASSAVGGVIASMLYEKIANAARNTRQEFGCWNFKKQTHMICKTVSDFIIPPAAAFTLLRTGVRFKKIRNFAKSLKGKKVNTIPIKELQAIPPWRLRAFTVEQIKRLSPVQIKSLTPAQIRALGPKQIRALTAKQIDFLRPSQIEALSGRQLRALVDGGNFVFVREELVIALTTKQLHSIGKKRLLNLSTAQTNALSNAQINTVAKIILPFTISSKKIKGFSLIQIRALARNPSLAKRTLYPNISALSIDQLNVIPPKIFRTWDTDAVRRFAPDKIDGLTTKQFSALTEGPKINALGINQMKILNESKLGSLTELQMRALDNNQLAALSRSQFDILSSRQLNALSTRQFGSLPTNFVQGLGPKVGYLRPNLVRSLGLGHMKALSLEQAQAFTLRQAKVLTGAQKNALGSKQREAIRKILSTAKQR